MGKMRWLKAPLYGIRLILAGIFLWASVPKILEPEAFLVQVDQYAITGPVLTALTAVVLPWTEFLIGLCLLVGLAVRGSFLVSALLLGLFTWTQISALRRGLSIDCGCGVPGGSSQISTLSVIRSGLFFAISSAGYVIAGCLPTRSRPIAEPLLACDGKGRS